MRTLKKSLALVLVLAMMFSLCVTASAYTDDAEIEFADEVALLSELGVLTGYPDGSFGPETTLNRAEAAAIVARLNGYFDTAAGTPTYTDMAGYGWANAAVAFCENEGIVNGTAEGIYEPGTTLTGYMFVKMLAVSMGVDAVEAGMTGAAWQIGVTKINKELGITAGIKDMDLAAPITRDQAAKCAYNALMAERDGYTWMVEHNGDKHYFTNEEDAILFWAATAGASKPVSGNYTTTLAYEVFKYQAYVEYLDNWGHPYYGSKALGEWLFGGPFAFEPVATWTTPITRGDVFAACSEAMGYIDDIQKDYMVFDGIVVDGKAAASSGTYDKASKTAVANSGNGTETYVYSTPVYGDRIVFINEYIGEVTKVDKAVDEIGADRLVTITNACALDNDSHNVLMKNETLNKGDVVLYNICNVWNAKTQEYDEYVFIIGAPETVSGSVTKVVNDSVYTIGETDYVLSKHHDCEIAKDMTATWYLDSHGNLMLKKADAKLDYQIGYLLAYDAQTVYEGDKMHGETYEASEKYVIFDAEKGLLELDGEAYSADVDKDGKLESYLPGQKAWIETKDAFTGDQFDIALGKGNWSTKTGALSKGLVLYLLNEEGEIYWISDSASIDGNLVINEYDALNVLSTSIYLTGNKAYAMGENTQYFYTGATKQTTVSTAVGYANAKKDLVLPGEYVWNKAANTILAVSQHSDPADEVPATAYLYVSDRVSSVKTEIGSYDKYNDVWTYVTTYTYTGLYLDGQELSGYWTLGAPLNVTGENIYKVGVYSDGTISIPAAAETKVMKAVKDFDAAESYIVVADGTDYILGTDVLYYQLSNHAVAPVDGLPALSVQYTVGLYYIDTITVAPGVTQTVVYFYVD